MIKLQLPRFRGLSTATASKQLTLLLLGTVLLGDGMAAERPAQPLKITPGKVVIPLDKMRRGWGELISIDLATRTGKFRAENTDEVFSFKVLPYAPMHHHATYGDLRDFRVGERAVFRLHENEAGKWEWLSYIQDEMNMMLHHNEFQHVDAIRPTGEIICTQANKDKSAIRLTDVVLQTDAQTRFWKEARPARLADIKVGDRLRTKTHGVGRGKVRVAWEVFLDEGSLLEFQREQKVVHQRRMQSEGAPGYVDEATSDTLRVTLFQEAGELAANLKEGVAVRVATAGMDRAAIGPGEAGKLVSTKARDRLCEIVISMPFPANRFHATDVVRLWITGQQAIAERQ